MYQCLAHEFAPDEDDRNLMLVVALYGTSGQVR